ncbi:hypothetical protein [Streptomyces sp. BR123]|uniref:hypothetical protein n=1 Tax=Streptomyces sp. BR123 TaxID=2749828 RepID=UPI00211B031A|nr:hypothetical protein [Streptomyces sp. BR123]
MAINFGPGKPWGAVSQHEYRRMARDERFALAHRVHFAALGWADRHGHASFGPNGLAAVLSKSGTPLSKQSTTGAVASAKRLDLVSPRSSAACLVLGSHVFQKERGAPSPCRTHPERP